MRASAFSHQNFKLILTLRPAVDISPINIKYLFYTIEDLEYEKILEKAGYYKKYATDIICQLLEKETNNTYLIYKLIAKNDLNYDLIIQCIIKHWDNLLFLRLNLLDIILSKNETDNQQILVKYSEIFINSDEYLQELSKTYDISPLINIHIKKHECKLITVYYKWLLPLWNKIKNNDIEWQVKYPVLLYCFSSFITKIKPYNIIFKQYSEDIIYEISEKFFNNLLLPFDIIHMKKSLFQRYLLIKELINLIELRNMIITYMTGEAMLLSEYLYYIFLI